MYQNIVWPWHYITKPDIATQRAAGTKLTGRIIYKGCSDKSSDFIVDKS